MRVRSMKGWLTASIGLVALLTLTSVSGFAGAQSGDDTLGAPVDLRGESTSTGARLWWTAPSTGDVTGYRVLRRRPDQESRLQVHVPNTGGTATTYTDTSVEDGVRYVYRVKALNDAEVGPQSNYVNVRMPAATPTATPPPTETPVPTTTPQPVQVSPPTLSLTAKPYSMDLSWDGVGENEQVTGYEILRRAVDEESEFKSIGTVSATADEYSDTDVKDEVKYRYVLDVQGVDDVVRSNLVEATYVEPLPAAPTGVGSRSDDAGMVLTWGAAEGNVTGYQILRRRPKECERAMVVHVQDTGDDAATWTDTDVEEGFTYVYRVKAVSAKGVGRQSNFTKRTYAPPKSVPSADAPRDPEHIQGDDVPDGILLRWSEPNRADNVTGYQIFRRRPDDCEGAMRLYAAVAESRESVQGRDWVRWIDENVEMETRYVYRVKAVNEHGAGPWSNYVSHTRMPPDVGLAYGFSGAGRKANRPNEMQISLSSLMANDDESTLDYTLRGDVRVKDTNEPANECEGAAMGDDVIRFYRANSRVENTRMQFGSLECPTGQYLLVFTLTHHHEDRVSTYISPIDLMR